MSAQTPWHRSGAWTAWQLWHRGADPLALAHLALRTKSEVVLDALALRATGGRDTARQVVVDPPDHVSSNEHLAAFALALAGLGRDQTELLAATGLYEHLWSRGALAGLPPRYHQGMGQSLFLAGRHDALRTALPHLSKLPPTIRQHLEIDLANPHLDDGPADPGAHARWQSLLSVPFVEAGLEPLRVTEPTGAAGPLHLFDRLGTADDIARSVDTGPLISVIIPCFRPDEGLLTSMASISTQSWSALEILVIDDASGPEFDEVFDRALASDPRARLVRMERNGGSYVGRNAALQQARGEFITFQDADDWSHPRRLEAQAQLLLDDAAVPASRSLAIRAKDDLTHQWFGYSAVRENASSLMVRRPVIDRIGPFLAVRKGADSEYAERIDAVAGPVRSTGTPLAITRLRSGTLSRGDFTYQWSTPERLSFKGTYRAWHRTLDPHLRRSPLGPGDSLPAPVPGSFVRGLGDGADAGRRPVALLGDFSTAPTPDRVDLVEQGAGPVGLWHLEDPDPGRRKRAEMHDGWFDLVVSAAGRLVPLHRSDDLEVGRLLVLDPGVLLLATAQPTRVRVGEVVVHLSPEDVRGGSTPLGLDVLGVADACREWFGVHPRWAPAPHLSQDAREELAELVPGLLR